ncbi:general stress protein [Nosocomiicoccus massiliensis]|uniref:general stress protein n=1 Tax=Nosocomiicoccus massiliensis TaxID=1232430 RepID=UPI00042A903A|nr:general stress protein [Nosocomiicoccus massiliensis]
MEQNRNIEVYDDIGNVSKRVQQLRHEGVNERRVILFSKHSPPTEFTREHDVEIRMGEGNLWQKFESLFTDKDGEERATEDLQFTPYEETEFSKAMDADQYVLYIPYQSIEQVELEDEEKIDLSKRDNY